MILRQLLYLSTALALVLSIENRQERKVNRLVGGHLRIINPDPDDSELMEANASGSKDNKSSKQRDDEEKKTLSQQVADGKYGLIQKELFKKPLKRPGVISYEANPEVPRDNINSLGGLSKDDIWLAENHLLVLKGGTYPPHDDKQDNLAPIWPPIDDYKAPNRPVKIPANPKVPPPFPVQLTDDGPLQILGTNSSRTLNGTLDEGAFAVPPPEGYVPGTGPYFPPSYPYPSDATPGRAPHPSAPNAPPGEYRPGAPFPPIHSNGTLPPFFASLPPGAVAVPPPGIDQYDEDDPSIYYPPPYSFYYQKDNSSRVPAGPLVPGIILPPPPNFFAPLNPPTTKKPIARLKYQTTTQQVKQIRPTTTPLPPTSVIHISQKKPIKLPPLQVPSEINNGLAPTVPTPPSTKIVTVLPVNQYPTKSRYPPQRLPPKQAVTILKPVKSTTNPPPNVLVYPNKASGKPFNIYGPPKKTVVSSTQIPLKVYYSTQNEIVSNSVTQQPEKYSHSIKPNLKPPAQYYFYEEELEQNSVTTAKPNVQNFFELPDDYYHPIPQKVKQSPQFVYVTSRPFTTAKSRYKLVQQPPKDSFSIHVANLKKQIHQYYTTQRPTFRQISSPRPVYQYSFEAANYKQNQNDFKPSIPDDDNNQQFRPMPKYSVQIQPAIEIVPTQKPQYKSSTPTVYFQQSFKANTERPQPSKYYNTNRPDYDYEDDVVPNQQPYIVTPKPITQYSFDSSQKNNYRQGYYQKPDNAYFEDITKQHFTMFGKKIPSATTPVPQQDYSSRSPISLQSDTVVNYVHPRPPVNPEAEIVNINSGKSPPFQGNKYLPRPPQQYVPTSQRQNVPEVVKSVPTAEGQAGSFISYQLPGDDGAHFYFLTPQLAQSRDQGAGFYYSQPDQNQRSRRSKRKAKR